MQSKTTFALLALLIMMSFSALACQSDVDDETPAARQDTLTIKDFKYSPKTMTLRAGESITVVNADRVQHTMACSDSIDTGALNPGDTKVLVFAKAGEYTCQSRSDVSPNLKTKVIVK